MRSDRARVALVTGGSRGIGRAIALRLARDGVDVAVTYVAQDAEAQAVAEEIKRLGRRSSAIALDVSDAAAVNRAVRGIAESWSGLHILVNNAGIFSRSMLVDTSDEEFARTFAVNVGGVFNCMRAVLPIFLAQRYGRIVNISSHLAKRGAGANTKATYAASKAAVDGYTKGVALEVSPFGITVNSVAPGWIEKTEPPAERSAAQMKMLEGVPVGRPGRPEEIAAAVAYLVSDDAAYVTGEVLDVNGGSWMD